MSHEAKTPDHITHLHEYIIQIGAAAAFIVYGIPMIKTDILLLSIFCGAGVIGYFILDFLKTANKKDFMIQMFYSQT